MREPFLNRPSAALLFFGSGAASLGFQIAWTRMFGAGLGQEMPSVLAVVAAIFGGMALGAWLADRALRPTVPPSDGPTVPSLFVRFVHFVVLKRLRSKLSLVARDSAFLWYGLIELLIGLWGFASIGIIPWANSAARQWIGLHASGVHHWLIAFAIPALTLLPSTAAMGATFPVLVDAFARQCWSRRCIGALYAANTAGAVAGVVGGLCWLLPRTGYSHGLICFSSLSLTCAAAAIFLSLRVPTSAPRTPFFDRPSPTSYPRTPISDLLSSTYTLLIAATGLLGIGYEVLIVRVLAQVLENTVYSYAAALSAYLIGTALGAALKNFVANSAGEVPDKLRDKVRGKVPGKVHEGVAGLLLALSAATFLGIWTLGHAQSIFDSVHVFLGDTAVGNWFAEFITASSALLLPAAIMGALVTELLERSASRLGWTWSINTFGGALAPALFGVVLLPALGAKGALLLLGLAAAALAVPLLLHPIQTLSPALNPPLNRPGRFTSSAPDFTLLWLRPRWWLFPAIGLALALTADLRILSLPPGAKVLSYRHGVSDSVAVLELADGHRSLLVNNRFNMGGTGAALAERRHGSIPLLLHPNPKRALFLGLGTGITFASAGPHPGLAADGVELVPEIVDALPWFSPQNTLPGPPGRFAIHIADARRYVQVCPNRYDVIVADLFHPARDGAGALYSLEDFRAVRARLTPGGLVCQWLPLFQLDAATLRMIVRTFLTVFPDAKAFLLRFNVDLPVLGLVSGLDRFDPGYFRARVTDPALLERLNAEQLRDLFQFLGGFVTDASGLRRFAANAPLNTDDHPRVLFTAPLRTSHPEPPTPTPDSRSPVSNLQTPNSEPRTPNPDLHTQKPPPSLIFYLLNTFPADPAQLVRTNSDAGLRFAEDLRGFVAARNVYLLGLAADAAGQTDAATNAYVESARLSPAFSLGYAQALTAAMGLVQSDPAAARHLLERLADARPERPVAQQLLQRLGAEQHAMKPGR